MKADSQATTANERAPLARPGTEGQAAVLPSFLLTVVFFCVRALRKFWSTPRHNSVRDKRLPVNVVLQWRA